MTEVTVKVGDTVAKGDVLATAEHGRPQARPRERDERPRVRARSACGRPKADLADAEDADVTAQIRQAKIGLYNAETQVSTGRGRSQRDQGPDGRPPASRRRSTGSSRRSTSTAGFDAPSGAAIVVDSTTFEITTDVVESDLADIKIGQEAAISVSRDRRGRHGHGDGHLARSPAATAAPASSSTRSRSRSTTCRPTARAGMTADVTITIRQREERPDRAGRARCVAPRATTASWSSAPTGSRRPSRSRSGS